MKFGFCECDTGAMAEEIVQHFTDSLVQNVLCLTRGNVTVTRNENIFYAIEYDFRTIILVQYGTPQYCIDQVALHALYLPYITIRIYSLHMFLYWTTVYECAHFILILHSSIAPVAFTI